MYKNCEKVMEKYIKSYSKSLIFSIVEKYVIKVRDISHRNLLTFYTQFTTHENMYLYQLVGGFSAISTLPITITTYKKKGIET